MNNNIKNNTKIVQNLISTKGNSMNKIGEEFCDKTKDFIRKLSNSSTEVIKNFLENNTSEVQLRSKQSKLYSYDNLFLVLSNGKDAYQLEQNLKLAKNNEAIPKFVSYYQLGQDEFLSILEGSTGELIPYSEAVGSISNLQKMKFKTDLKNYLDQSGYVNKEIFANKSPLFFSKNNGNIIYGDWSQLSLVESNFNNYYKNMIERTTL